MLCIRERDIEMLRVSTHEFCGREVTLDFDDFHASLLIVFSCFVVAKFSYILQHCYLTSHYCSQITKTKPIDPTRIAILQSKAIKLREWSH